MSKYSRNMIVTSAAVLMMILFLTACQAEVSQQYFSLEETPLHISNITQSQKRAVCVQMKMRNLTVLTKQEDSSDQIGKQDSSSSRILDLTMGAGEAFETLRRDQLIDYQKRRQITSACDMQKVPEELLKVFKDVLADTQQYGHSWDMERLSVYEDTQHEIELEQVYAYLGEVIPDYYEWGNILCAYLTDLDKDNSEELVLFYESEGTAGYAYIDIWQQQKNGTVEQLYHILQERGYCALLNYHETQYFVVCSHNFNTGEMEGLYIFTAGTEGKLQEYWIGLGDKENHKLWIETYHNTKTDTDLEQKLSEYIETIKEEVENKTVNTSAYELIDGNAETDCQDSEMSLLLDAFDISEYGKQACRVVDFDNDGKMEIVQKMIMWPSSLGIMRNMTTNFYKEFDTGLCEIQVIFPCFYNTGNMYDCVSSYGTPVDSKEIFYKTPVQLWFQKFDQKICTFYLYQIEYCSDYLLEVSLIEHGTLQPLRQFLLIAEKEYAFEEHTVERFSVW